MCGDSNAVQYDHSVPYSPFAHFYLGNFRRNNVQMFEPHGV